MLVFGEGARALPVKMDIRFVVLRTEGSMLAPFVRPTLSVQAVIVLQDRRESVRFRPVIRVPKAPNVLAGFVIQMGFAGSKMVAGPVRKILTVEWQPGQLVYPGFVRPPLVPRHVVELGQHLNVYQIIAVIAFAH
jgi:hypothetical protein